MSNNDINVVINEVRAAHKPIDKEVHHGDAPGFEYKRCATTVVNLGNHYTVIKHKDAEAICGPEWKQASIAVMLDRIEDHNMLRGQREYLVIESDWPEYEPVKQALLARINGSMNGQLQYYEKDNVLKLDMSQVQQLQTPVTHVQYAAVFGEGNGEYTEWLDHNGQYCTLPAYTPVPRDDWTPIPNGAQAQTESGTFFKWVNQFVFILRDTWEPTGYRDVADFLNHNWGKLKWQREPLCREYVQVEDKTKATPEDQRVKRSKEDLFNTYWQGLTSEQKRAAIAHVMQDDKQTERRESDNLAHKYPHYHKDVSKFNSVDVYRVIDLFGVTEHTIGHAIKKLLCAGVRGAKDREKDVREAVDTLNRHLQMKAEDCNGN